MGKLNIMTSLYILCKNILLRKLQSDIGGDFLKLITIKTHIVNWSQKELRK